MIWIGRIEIESEFHQYFLIIIHNLSLSKRVITYVCLTQIFFDKVETTGKLMPNRNVQTKLYGRINIKVCERKNSPNIPHRLE